MRYRKLRIVLSAGCGIVCLLLIALWVRSYRWDDILSAKLSSERGCSVTSLNGSIEFAVFATTEGQWARYSIPADLPRMVLGVVFDSMGFGIRHIAGQSSTVKVPHFFAILLLSGMAFIIWRWRFSLRAMLITTTLVSAVLGLAVWAAGK